jgi:hypothetical protein
VFLIQWPGRYKSEELRLIYHGSVCTSLRALVPDKSNGQLLPYYLKTLLQYVKQHLAHKFDRSDMQEILSPKETYQLRDLGVVGRIILKWVLHKYSKRLWTGFN